MSVNENDEAIERAKRLRATMYDSPAWEDHEKAMAETRADGIREGLRRAAEHIIGRAREDLRAARARGYVDGIVEVACGAMARSAGEVWRMSREVKP